ncbi:MAG: DNA polymerase III subunit alpha [Chitinivibrionales bacterium]|nr:DNA polymerase III subunit alpha [Chitinivibrionales bacterium]
MKGFLPVVSYFSLHFGTHSPQQICFKAAALGYSTLAVLDRNNLYGLPEFLRWCTKLELKLIIGAEIVHRDRSAYLLSRGDAGYANLCRVISEKYCDDRFEIVDAVRSDPQGLVVIADDEAMLARLCSYVDELYYKQISPQRLPPRVRDAGYKSLVIPPAVFFAESDFETHRILRAVDCNTSLSKLPAGEVWNASYIFRTWNEIAERFEVFGSGLEANKELAEHLHSRSDFGIPYFPHLNTAPPPIALLREKAYLGLERRFGEVSEAAFRRLEYELELIDRKNFASYFLIVDDIVKESPRTCGRGSGAASLVAYALGITNVDPLRHNLMFERFLSPGRKDPPDIDVDFAWDERDGVIDYVFRTYGDERAAMVATHLTFGPRMAVREVARVYGLTESEISTITENFPWYWDKSSGEMSIEQTMRNHPRLKHIELDEPWPGIMRVAQRLAGIPCAIGTHPGGMVITPGPIRHAVPVQIAPKGVQIIQWEKDGAEEMGLVKIDLLGNRSLAVIRDAVANLRGEGIEIDEFRWDPVDDVATRSLLQSGRSMGVFYVESPPMRLLQEKAGQGDFEHLVIHSSIIRPAANRWITEYLRRLHGGAWQAEHHALNDVLAETFGIMVYQEDVSKVAMALAGFDFEAADKLRKIMTKKTRREQLADYRIRFINGARQRGVSDDAIQTIWNMMLSFAGYSFCKPHSASYCQVSFQSAWLKAHYPAAFMASVVSNFGGFYVTQAYISEAFRLGLTVKGPDVNRSCEKFVARDATIMVGLGHIKGLTKNALRKVLEQRDSGGLFVSLSDLLQRTRIDEADADRLVASGACDFLEPEFVRPQLFWIMRCFYQRKRREPVPDLPPFEDIEIKRMQYRSLGFLTDAHPLSLVKRSLERTYVSVKGIKSYVNQTVTFVGWCITSKTVATKHGESMQFVTFEDEYDLVETVMFPGAYRKFAKYVTWLAAFYVTGKVTQDFGAYMVEVSNIVAVGKER